MKQINVLLLECRVANDPKYTYENEDKQKCTFNVANQGSGDDVNFFTATAKKGLAKICNDNLCKGRHILIEGEIYQSRYTQRGADHETNFIGIRIHKVRFLDDKKKINPTES
jgi:single-stranded DNA-binding protein